MKCPEICRQCESAVVKCRQSKIPAECRKERDEAKEKEAEKAAQEVAQLED